MEKKKTNIDDLFKSSLGSYTEVPPPAVWDALERRLDNPAKPRSPYTWLGYVAIVAILLISGIITGRYIAGNTNNTDKPTAANTDNMQPVEKGNNSNTVAGIKNSSLHSNDNSIPATTAPYTDDKQAGVNPITVGKEASAGNAEQTSNDITADKRGNNANQKNAPTGSSTRRPENNYNSGTPTAINGRKNATHKEPRYASAKKKKTSVQVNTAGSAATPDNELTETSTPPQHVYNSSPSQANEPQSTATPHNDSTTVTNKDTVKKADQKVADNKKKKLPKPRFARFEAGIKAGYEGGFDNDAAKKIVATPYVQYKITRKFAIMLQPGIKSATIAGKRVGNAISYYNVNNDGTVYPITDSIPVHIIGTTDSFWLWNYSYVQTHDSIVKTYTTSATYIEFELPVLLKYYITKDFSVYGGVNMVYSKLVGLTEQTYTTKGIQKMVTETGIGPVNSVPPPPPSGLTSEITYPGTPFSSYRGPLYPVPQGSLLRFGYMIGFSYEYQKWLFDALVQQAPVSAAAQGGYNTNTPMSAPYFRLTIGYKLTK